MTRTNLTAAAVLALSAAVAVPAANALSVRLPHEIWSKPGYIDSMSLEITCDGVFAQQDLVAHYADHGVYGSGGQLEVMHRFELPSGAVAHDLYLWIGDYISRAIINDTRAVRHVYDSITGLARDPAFLNVVDNQYELRIYPLPAGSNRKVKLTIVTPVRYVGGRASIDLPFGLIRSDNNAVTPLLVRFRTVAAAATAPSLAEFPAAQFDAATDSAGRPVWQAYLTDIRTAASLTLQYRPALSNGCFWTALRTDSATYCGIGVYRPECFPDTVDSAARTHRRLVGLDASGFYGAQPDSAAALLDRVLRRYVPQGDSFRLVITGEGVCDTFPADAWRRMDSASLATTLSEAQAGRVMSAKQQVALPRILFVESYADSMWSFPGLSQLAQVGMRPRLLDALADFDHYDVVASYTQGFSRWAETCCLSDAQADSVVAAINRLFARGGTFLMYYDFFRTCDKIATRLVQGLVTPTAWGPAALTRQAGGFISDGFPQTLWHNRSCALVNTDPEVVAELRNEQGNPVVISKRLGEGHLIVTGMWHCEDDAAIKRMLCTTLLTLQRQTRYRQLPQLIASLAAQAQPQAIDGALIVSNSDALVTAQSADSILGPMAALQLGRLSPLLALAAAGGPYYAPPTYTAQGRTYYGSGYLLKALCDWTGGGYLATHESSWEYIGDVLAQGPATQSGALSLSVAAGGVMLPGADVVEVGTDQALGGRLRTWLCRAPAGQRCDVTVRLQDGQTEDSLTFAILPADVPATGPDMLPTMFSAARIRAMLNCQPVDSAAVTAVAIASRIITNLTAFIALEPADTVHPVVDPAPDQPPILAAAQVVSRRATRPLVETVQAAGLIAIRVNAPAAATARLRLFDLAGRCVFDGTRRAADAGAMAFEFARTALAAGVYLAVVEVTMVENGVPTRRTVSVRLTTRP